jgi:hypothetical protein
MRPTNDKPISDQDLLMIYFKEAQQQLDDCLNDPESCQRLDQLEAHMKTIEEAQNQHQLPDDYGQQLWHQIADQLVLEDSSVQVKRTGWLQQFKNMLMVPQYSLASFVVIAGLVMVAFFAGKQQNPAGLSADVQEQLLAQNIQLHLTQSEIFLTQVSNGSDSFNSQATAQRLLSSNRIFKQALANHDGQFTHQVLLGLEPILLEYANKAPSNNLKQNHGQQPRANWVNDSNTNDLMFQIKAMKQQLAQQNDII